MKTPLTLLCLLALALGAEAQTDLRLSDFVLSPVSPRGIGAVKPAANGKSYYQLIDRGRTIVRSGYATGEREAVVLDSAVMASAGVRRWDGYEMSRDESRILLHTASQPIYRHSFRANYYIYNRADKTLKPLSERPNEEIATLSPDGKHVAYVSQNNVYIADLVSGRQTQVTTDGEINKIINAVPDWVYQEEFGIINSFAWSPDGQTLSFIRWDETNVPMYSMTLYEGDCHPNADYALYPGSYDYKYPVAGQPNAIVSVHSYNLATGSLSRMSLPITAEDYVPHIAYAGRPDALMVMTLNRDQNDLRIYRVNPASGQATQVYQEQSTTWIDSEMARNVAYFDDTFVIPSERSGYCQLYRYSLDGKLLGALTSGKQPVTAFYGYDARRGHYYYQATDGPLNRVVMRTDNRARMQPVAATSGTNSAAFSADYTYYIHTFSNAQTPTQYSVCRTDRKQALVRQLETNDTYRAKYTAPNVPQRQFVAFVNDAGDSINGFIIKPTDFDPTRKYPVIMSQYSGPGSQQVRNNWKMDWENYFATQGYIVACFDGRGTGGRGKAFESVTYLNLGHYETLDQIAAARYMASQPWVDADRIGIWGWSFGGYEVLMAMSHPDSHYAAGVSIAPVTSWRFYDTVYAERFMLTPEKNPNGYAASAPLDKVDNLKGDLLIMFGSADDNVHVINAMQYIAKLHGRGSQFEMMVYPNMNHSINGCGVREPLYQRVLNFFDRKLKQ